ncbi:hypothetical protein [Petrotoga sp. 9PWA.NaAc.5.4]|uniref:hypothetical protein n=1 Tax=Petrotoga sp. 9PWA.NaAc.5.4 TaxID=1434328 RepID=UPI000CBC8D9B|nr:hypothetical protein [Petrotoga sp. 9PWA.NaAc.5.4]PNR93390.1 hypothetical protein X924_08150 [Petrotoga sp. 9PWA.NaAc.5.4]
MRKSLFYMVALLSIVFALTGCLPKTVGQEPPVPVVSIKAYLPGNTPDNATIYIVGNYCGWGFDNAATSTVKTEDGQKYAEFELQVTEFPLKYKYTIGPSWNYVEKDAEGNEIGDRVIESAPEGVVIDTVAKWAAIPTPPSEEPTIVNIKAYLPDETPDDATIYIVGNYCGWGFDNAATSTVKTEDGQKYAEFELQVTEFPLKYKYTIGPSWNYVEKDAEGNEIGDRVIESAPEGVVIDTVAKWAAIPTPPSEEPTIVNIKAYLPDETPDDATIYIVGNYCGWGFDNAATSTVKTEDGQKYAEFELQITEFPFEYKYTVGPDWKYEEVKADGSRVDNRKIDSAPESLVEDTVEKWKEIPESQEPTEPPSEEGIIIDGDFSDWESYEGTKKIEIDSDDDSKWGATNDVKWLGVAVDEEFLYIGAQYKASGNGFIVYISKENDDTGATDMNFGGWPRAITFNKKVQYFVATWEYQDPQLWQVVDAQTKTDKSSSISDKYVKQNEGYEIKIPLSELGLEIGDKIYFVGCIVGGDGASSPDTIPDNDYPENWDWNVPINITTMAEFVIP